MPLTSDEEKKRGLYSTYVYWCLRCGYLWLPRGYDIYNTRKIETRKSPKACARCKTRAWNKFPLSKQV